jgi:hypothetical protein
MIKTGNLGKDLISLCDITLAGREARRQQKIPLSQRLYVSDVRLHDKGTSSPLLSLSMCQYEVQTGGTPNQRRNRDRRRISRERNVREEKKV